MASLVLSGDTSGSITVAAPAVAGSNTQTLAAVTGTLAPIVSGTAVSASGTSVDFTGIPSWAKRVTVMFNGVSTTGSSNFLIQLGDSGGIETTAYTAYSVRLGNATVAAGASNAAGFPIVAPPSATDPVSGQMQFSNLNGNVWVGQGLFATAANNGMPSGGGKTLSDTLDRLRITTVNGTDTFDAGTINIMWE